MTTTFWMLAVAMTAIALVFTIPPLFSSRRELQLDRNQLNAEVIKDQLKELELDGGVLVEQVDQGAAGEAGVRQGDIIVRIDNKPVI